VLPAHPVVPRSAVVIPPLSAIKHTVSPLPAIPLNRMREPENLPYLAGKLPFKLVNFTTESPQAFGDLWRFPFFNDAFPGATVDFYPYNMPVRNIGPHFVTLQEALREIDQPSGKFRTDPQYPGSYALWNMNTAAWKTVR
jgi:hypothetical protein